MDMNLREWLIVFGGVIIAGIVIDGIRRMRRARRDSLEISMGMGGEIENSPLDEGFNPELPNGGARLANSANRNVAEETEHHTDVDYTQDSSEPSQYADPHARIEPSIEAGNIDIGDDNLSAVRVVARKDKRDAVADSMGSVGESAISNEPASDEKNAVVEGEIRATKPTAPAGRANSGGSKPKTKMTFGEGLKASSSKIKPSSNKSKQAKKEQKPKPAQEVIVLNVMSKSAEGFKGSDLNTLLEACGVEHGDMSIFHRHEGAVDSPVQFSVANAVEPGYFPKDQLDNMTTPGICFFMSLPGPEDNMRAFDYMVETAQCVVRNLSGEMKDERRSDMTPQTLEHCRQRIRDFERRQLAARC